MASSEVYEVVLSGGAPWGFRLQGGKEFRAPLRIAKVSCHKLSFKFDCHVNILSESLPGYRSSVVKNKLQTPTLRVHINSSLSARCPFLFAVRHYKLSLKQTVKLLLNCQNCW